MLRQIFKPKSKTSTDYLSEKHQNSIPFLTEDEEDFKFMALQNLSPKFKSSLSDEFLRGHVNYPENLIDSDEDKKVAGKIFRQIERMKSSSCIMKKTTCLSNKGDPLTPDIRALIQSKSEEYKPFRNLIFNPNCKKEILKNHLRKLHSSLVYGLYNLNKNNIDELITKDVHLGDSKEKNQKTLFLDLDETLIRSVTLEENPSYVIKDGIFAGELAFGFNIRPYCREFIKSISEVYEVYIFTASSEIYANSIIDIIDPYKKYIRGILFREHCIKTKKGVFIKDLRIIKNREMKNMLIVDNNAHAFALQLENGIPILDWKGDRKDRELKYLLKFLYDLAEVDDVRSVNKEILKLEKFAKVKDLNAFLNFN